MLPLKLFSRSLLTLVVGGICVSFSAKAGTKFLIEDPLKRDVVSFTLTAPLEEIQGQSFEIKGWFDILLKDLQKEAKGELTIPTSSFTTQNALRDQHMHDTYLNVSKFPEMKFILKAIRLPDGKEDAKSLSRTLTLTDRQPTSVLLKGSLSLHGSQQEVTVPATLTYYRESPLTESKYKGDLLQIQAEFSLKLADYLIDRPQVVTLQVGEVARVRASLTGLFKKTPAKTTK